MESNYVFSANTLTLYHLWDDQPLNVVARNYPQIIAELSQKQINQYNLWRALPTATKDYIENNRGPTVVTVTSHQANEIDFSQLDELARANLITSVKALDNEYVQVTDRQGHHYLVYGRYDAINDRIVPH